MAVLYTVLLIFLGFQHAFGDYNDNCPDLSESLGSDCSTNSDCTKITCSIKDKGGKLMTWTIKINKCQDPVTVDVSVSTLDLDWSKTFSTDERIGVPGLSGSLLGLSGGIYVKVSLPDSGSNLNLKVELLVGVGYGDNFQQFGDSVTLVDSPLPISTDFCGFVRWWSKLSVVFKILLVIGAAIVIIGPCICCCVCCCCRSKQPGTVIMQPPPASVISSTNTNVPMKPFVNEA